MELFDNLALGFATASTLWNLLYCFVGVLLGTLIGVLPGIGADGDHRHAVADHLPDRRSGLVADHALRHLLRRAVWRLDHRDPDQHAWQIVVGRHRHRRLPDGPPRPRGPALAICRDRLVLRRHRLDLPRRHFRPAVDRDRAEIRRGRIFFADGVGLVSSIALAHGSIVKALAMVVLGLLLGLVGTDIYTGAPRFTLGIREYADGLNFVAVAVGVFGIAEILRNLENEQDRTVVSRRSPASCRHATIFKAWPAPIVRGTVIGSALGILPGGGAVLAAFASYTVEKRSPNPEEFGRGAIEGVAGPEIGQQCRRADLVHPDADAWHSRQPGHGADDRRDDHPGHHARPQRRHRAAGAVLGHHRLDVDRQPDADRAQPAADRAVGEDADDPLLRAVSDHHGVLRDRRLQRQHNVYDLYAVAFFGFIGYVLVKLRCEPAPLLLGFVLGPLLEENLRRAMILSRGDPTTSSPARSARILLFIALAALVVVFLPAVRKKREEVFVEEE